MFGYVKPYVPTLQVQEFSLYRAVYCGLCREMGLVTGQLSRITLSYDFCFLALLLLALSDAPSAVEKIRYGSVCVVVKGIHIRAPHGPVRLQPIPVLPDRRRPLPHRIQP